MTDPAAEVRRLRTEEQLSVREIQARASLGRNRVYELLRGLPPPARTRRPNAKDDLRAETVELRAAAPARRPRFVNSDPALIELFLRFAEALGEHRGALRYRVAIHETADVEIEGS
ncbi:hypothetical protein [Micromonospora radicis]|uniref:hypothetical protein n=1 Tax=Micromonospora radicis TaxID=1894971 RepID=UPI0018F6C7CF|nr:hypothetical protein [Micromonospora radicis]